MKKGCTCKFESVVLLGKFLGTIDFPYNLNTYLFGKWFSPFVLWCQFYMGFRLFPLGPWNICFGHWSILCFKLVSLNTQRKMRNSMSLLPVRLFVCLFFSCSNVLGTSSICYPVLTEVCSDRVVKVRMFLKVWKLL